MLPASTNPQSQVVDPMAFVGPLKLGISLCGPPATTPGPVLPPWTASDRDGGPSAIFGSALSIAILTLGMPHFH